MLIAADYSQIELRVLAHLSGDPALVDAFTPRRRTSTPAPRPRCSACCPAPVSADMRRAAKVINFGILYGMGPQRLAGELGIPLAEAQGYIANYFDRYAGRARTSWNGVVADGPRARLRRPPSSAAAGPLPELRSRERGVAQAAERVAANTPIQGSAADLIKLAMVARRAPPAPTRRSRAG